MSVTQVHQGLGGWQLQLRTGGGADDFVARLNPWDHVFITPRGLGPQPDLQSLKQTALFAGRLDEVEVDAGSMSIGGPGVAVWLGDEAGRGRYPDSGQTQTVLALDGVLGWLNLIFGPIAGQNLNGLFLGNWQNLPTNNFGWEFGRFTTARQKIDELAQLADRPFEWLVLPSGEVQIEGWRPSGRSGFGPGVTGTSSTIDYTRTLFAFFPQVMLDDGGERIDGTSDWTLPQVAQVPVQCFPADVAVKWDFSAHAARGIARGNDNGTPLRSTGTNKDDRNTNGFSYDPSVRIGWDTIVDFDTTVTGELDAAAASVARLASIRREWTVQALSTDVVGALKPGDYVWVHSDRLPGIGSMTYANEADEWAGINDPSDPIVARIPQAANVNVGGRNVYPARARVDSMTWPVTDRFDVWYAQTWDGSGQVRNINDLVDFEPEGPVDVDCNATKPRWQLQRKVLGTTFARNFDLDANSKKAR